MRRRFIHSPLLCLVALVAFVHQLGAGACGCIEHNGWVQAACVILDCPLDAEHHHGSHAGSEIGPGFTNSPAFWGFASESIPEIEHSHCDDCSPLVYTVSSSRSLTEIAVSVWSTGVEAFVTKTVFSDSSVSQIRHHRQTPNDGGLALPLRAELQIFLI